MSLPRSLLRLAALLALLPGVVACAGSPSASALPTPALTVSGAWVRPAAAGSETAAYLTIANAGGTDDALLGASSPVAAGAMLHATSTDPSGMTGMTMVDTVAVAAHATVALQPGGTHLMLTGLTRALDAGGTVELRLTFAHAGTIVVSAAVRSS